MSVRKAAVRSLSAADSITKDCGIGESVCRGLHSAFHEVNVATCARKGTLLRGCWNLVKQITVSNASPSTQSLACIYSWQSGVYRRTTPQLVPQHSRAPVYSWQSGVYRRSTPRHSCARVYSWWPTGLLPNMRIHFWSRACQAA